MKQATREEYERAKRLALAGIEAHKERAQLREPPTAEALLQTIGEKAERGEPPTEKERAALAAALAAANPPKRGRGRPKGSDDRPAKRAFSAALVATEDCGLTTYRKPSTPHRMTRCDALAEAMNEAGYTSLTTYDAAAEEMKAIRKALKRAAEKMRAAVQPMQVQLAAISANVAPIIARLRRAVKLSPETIEAIKKHDITKR